jgi:hypothetical protein
VRNATDESVLRWDSTSNTTATIYTHTGDHHDLGDLHAFDGDLYIAKESSGVGEIERRQTDNTLVWENDTTDLGAYHLDTTSEAAYVSDKDAIEKWSHSGTLEYKTTFGSDIDDFDTGNDTFAYVVESLDVKQVYQSNGTKTSFGYESRYVPQNVVTGPDGYVYIDDYYNLTVLDPADGSVAYRREFSFAPEDIEVHSNNIYMVTSDETVVKLALQGL